jgi:hypothetical protein
MGGGLSLRPVGRTLLDAGWPLVPLAYSFQVASKSQRERGSKLASLGLRAYPQRHPRQAW